MLICSSVLVLIAPLPPVLLDVMLAANITLAVLILLGTIYVRSPLEFSVFPTILLATTLSRLVLNVASTRLILTGASSRGTEAAGGVISAFGEFVAGGSTAVGLVIFGILLAIQFLVITKGATRISEVAARFALDGMPGKQMAIDADLNAGLISQDEAKTRREEVAEQADFYGQMDGASKFVRGDAVASLVITAINLLGGLYIGMVNEGMALAEAAAVFSQLTIGDGLVTQVPTFLISIAAGLIVTRSSSESDLPRDVLGQMFRHPAALTLAGVFIASLSFTGLPTAPLLGLGTACVIGGVLASQSRAAEAAAEEREAEQTAARPPEAKPEDHLEIDPLELELGVGLVRLAKPETGGDLVERVTKVRHRIAEELGMVLPKVRIRDNVTLGPSEYRIKIRDIGVAWGELFPDARLAIDTGLVTSPVSGLETVDPAFGRPARWVEGQSIEQAELHGYNVVEPSAVVVTHLTEIVRDHAAELLTRQQVHALLDHLRQTAPQTVEEVTDQMKTAQIHQVLSNLLRERVAIRDLEAIVETLGDYADRSSEPTILTEYVRHALARLICGRLRDAQRTLHVITLDPAVEDVLAAGFEFGERGLLVRLAPQTAEAFAAAVAEKLQPLVAAGRPPVLVCNPTIRAGVRNITLASLPKLAVLSLNEITRDTEVQAYGQVAPSDLAVPMTTAASAAPAPPPVAAGV